MSEHSLDLVVVGIVILSRLLVPLAIPRFPLPAIVAALIIDAVDQTIFQQFTTTINLDGYQTYDKALDVYYLTVAYISTMRNWQNLAAFEVSRFLYFYRLVGVVLFELFQARALLLVFPNTFEYFFIFYEAVRTRWDPRRMSRRTVVAAAAFIWIFIKLPQEYWIHVAQRDVTDTLRANPVLIPILAVAIVAVVVGAVWYVRNRAPAPDWAFTLDATHRTSDVTRVEVEARRQQMAQQLFDWELAEKIVMISLVSVIFGRVLPDVNLGDLELAGVVAAIIFANTVVSELLVRRGHGWSSAVQEFLVVLGINLSIVLGAYFLFDTRVEGDRLRDGAALFFVLLLSLLVTLYDRYRPVYVARERSREFPMFFREGKASLREVVSGER